MSKAKLDPESTLLYVSGVSYHCSKHSKQKVLKKHKLWVSRPDVDILGHLP